jgi:hypothetical protein
MTTSALVKLGGLAAMVGGVASTALGLLTTLPPRHLPAGPSVEKAVQKGSYEVPVLFISLLGAIAAIAALHALQRGTLRLTGSGGCAFVAGRANDDGRGLPRRRDECRHSHRNDVLDYRGAVYRSGGVDGGHRVPGRSLGLR